MHSKTLKNDQISEPDKFFERTVLYIMQIGQTCKLVWLVEQEFLLNLFSNLLASVLCQFVLFIVETTDPEPSFMSPTSSELARPTRKNTVLTRGTRISNASTRSTNSNVPAVATVTEIYKFRTVVVFVEIAKNWE